MIKALEFRFGSASARSLIYLMSGIVVLLGGAALAFFYWQTSEFRKIETLANGYHLATLDACASIKEELFLLEKVSDQKSPPQGNGLVLPNQINSSAHIIEQRTDHILLLQDTFRQPEFQATVRSLEARTRQLLRLVAAGEAGGEIASALLQKEVASLQVVTGQLQRLHASSYKEATARLTAQQQLNTRNLFIFVGVLLAVGFLVIWRIVVVTAAQGPKEKEYGPTVVLAIFLAGGIFLLDLLAPLGVAGAVPYVALVLVSLSLPRRKHTLAAATLASVLTVLGFFLSPAGGTLWVVLANRGLALFAIWVTATLGLLRKQAEQTLRFTQVAVDHYSDLAFWMTPDARFFYVNDAACRVLGYSREELTSMKVPDINLDISEETWPKIWSKIKQGGGFTLEARIRTKDGRIFPAEVKTNYVVFQGKEYNCSLIRDITERKRAEQALRQSESSLAVAQRIAHLGSWEWNIANNRAVWSEEAGRLFGLSPQQLTTTHDDFVKSVHPDDWQFVEKAVNEALYEGKPYGLDYRIIRPDGAVRIMHSQGEVSFDQAGKPVRMTGTVQDITERMRAEETLHASRERLRYLVSSGPAVFYSSKPSGDYGATFISENVAKQTGYEARDFIEDSKFWANHIHPEDAPLVFAGLPRVFERGEHIHEYRFLHKDGSYRWMRDELKLIRDSAGNPLEIIGCWTDITERKRAEEALRFTQFAVDRAPVAAYWMDPKARFFYVNDAACSMLGFTREELLSMTVHDIDPDYPAEAWPEFWRTLKQRGSFTIEAHHRAKDGRIFPVEIAVNYLEFGGKEYNCSLVHDITERKRAEQALRQQAQVIDQIHDSVVSTDLDGYVTSWNKGAEKLYGYRAEEVLGKHISLVYLDGDRQFSHDQVIGPLLELEEMELETQRRRKSGELFDIHLSLSLLHDDKGTPTGTIGYSLDITERKRAEENLRALTTRLEQSNRELQNFASVAAHDLQEPLRKVLMFGDRLQAKCHQALTDQGRDYMDRMLNAAARMQTLIDNLLAFSRVTIQPQPFVPVDLNAVAREVLSDLEGRIVQEGGRVEIGHLPTIEADRTQMRQLLQNLISNALKFHREKEIPVVSIRGKVFNDRMQPPEGNSPGDGLCQIIVEDNGIGFDQKYADRIFGIFQRLHGRQEFQGTGIGLALCRRIAERHGGSITAQSKPGQGTTFTVRLPIKQHQGEKVA